ncbi:MAG: tyrosine--tRNA ligase [Bdellovibrionota bacterium]
MDFINEMGRRGLIAQVNHEDELGLHLEEKPRVAYLGFDPTADSLHVGHFLGAMILRRWQKAGHKAVALVGGGTAIVGDPSGKSDLRKMLDDEAIEHNIACFRKQLHRFIDLNDSDKGELVNNADWLLPLNYLEFMREYGKNFSVNRMLTAECFKQRLEKGLTFLEFNYMILQSYDFLELNRRLGVTVQLGGDDQWSNMLSGVDLVRRVTTEKSFCLTFPLLTTSDGRKMGKTESGAVWLDPNKTAPFDFFQYWRNVEDNSVKKLLMYLTELDMDEIEDLSSREGKELNESKVRLAFEITKLVHGEEEADKAKITAAQLFSGGSRGGTGNEPEVFISKSNFNDSMNILDLLMESKILSSKAEGRRLIQQGGLTLNGKKIDDVKYMVSREEVFLKDGCLIRKGKKHYYRLRIS